MSNFNYMASVISRISHKIPPLKIWKINVNFGELYDKFWNPMNYAIIGGTGVLINMMLLLSLAPTFPLWVANIIAILTAWTWNWTMSVGPLGYLWGFKKKGGEK